MLHVKMLRKLETFFIIHMNFRFILSIIIINQFVKVSMVRINSSVKGLIMSEQMSWKLAIITTQQGRRKLFLVGGAAGL